jgi:hypothetical protein
MTQLFHSKEKTRYEKFQEFFKKNESWLPNPKTQMKWFAIKILGGLLLLQCAFWFVKGVVSGNWRSRPQ